jgi:hypothetical protein
VSTPVRTDERILQILNSDRPASIADAIDVMKRLDNVLPGSDGVRWFNTLYLSVTQTVQSEPPEGGWNNPAWLTRLDVLFANLYFNALKSRVSGSGEIAKSWKVLFDARHEAGLDRIQFALAGMNAHINHDLAFALLQTDAEFNITPTKSSPEHADFEHVNGLLAAVLPKVLNTLATGIVGEIVQSTGKIGQLLALWNVRAARDLAWDFADHLRTLNDVPRQFAVLSQDQLTGAIGRALLLKAGVLSSGSPIAIA